jgi:hypothetical protein
MKIFKTIIAATLVMLSFSSIADDVLICFEAEDTATIKEPMKQSDLPKEASKEKIIEITQGSGEGTKVGGNVTYRLEIPEDGSYYFWSRVWWIDSCGNSFSVKFDKGPVFIFGNDRTYKSWHWQKSRVKLPLKKGSHTLTISNREDGIKIDQFLLTNDKSVVPDGIEDSIKLEK